MEVVSETEHAEDVLQLRPCSEKERHVSMRRSQLLVLRALFVCSLILHR